MIARRGLRRAGPGRWASILLGALVLISIGAGLLHSTGLAVNIGSLTAMDFHVGAAIAAVPFAIWHVLARRVKLRPTDISRRAALRGGLRDDRGRRAHRGPRRGDPPLHRLI